MKQQNKQPSHVLLVFSVIFLSYIALIPLIGYLFSITVAMAIVTILGIISIVGAIYIAFNGYLRNPKIRNIFLLVGVLSTATLIFYTAGQKREVTTSSVTKEVNAKVVTEYGFSSNFRVVLVAGDNVIPVEDVKNWRDFHIGDAVYGIETINETTTITNVYGGSISFVKEYVLLKGKE